MKKRKLVSFMILIIAIVTGGSIMLRMRGFEGKDIAVAWFLVLVGILTLLDLIYLIIIPIIKYPRERREEETINNALNQTTKFSFWDP